MVGSICFYIKWNMYILRYKQMLHTYIHSSTENMHIYIYNAQRTETKQ